MTTPDPAELKRLVMEHHRSSAGADIPDPIFVIAEGDLVVHCLHQPQPEPEDPDVLFPFFHYDVHRIVHGEIVEHWSGLHPLAAFTPSPLEATASEAPALIGPPRSAQELAANKQRVADFFHFVFGAHDADAVRDYVTEGYIQHAAHVEQGCEGLERFVRAVFPDGPLAIADEPVPPAFAIAEGDIVVFGDRIPQPDPHRPGEFIDYFTFDGFRIEDGLLAEHWSGINKVVPPVH